MMFNKKQISMFKHVLSILVVLFFSFSGNKLLAQGVNNYDNTLTTDDVIYKKEFSIGLKAHTNGFGIGANVVRIKNIYKKRVYEFEIMGIKHVKERRQQSLYATGRTSIGGYVYGKQNNFYTINASIGNMHTLSGKGKRKGVQIFAYYAFGGSLGITKPYYLELIVDYTDRDLITNNERYTPQNESLFLNPNRIFGASGFAFGWTEINLFPGLQAKAAINFDWATYKEMVKALEIGVMVNIHGGFTRNPETDKIRLSRVPIMINAQNNFMFTNFYLKLNLGKRS